MAIHDELKPCPFCGSPKPGVYEHLCGWTARCGACGAEIDRDTREEAVAAWNRRAEER
jgi:transcription elongation factor Elf1